MGHTVKALLFFIAGAAAYAQFSVVPLNPNPRAAILPSAAFASIDSTGMDSTSTYSYDAFGFGWCSPNGDLHILARRGREHVDVTGFVSQWTSTDDGTTWTRATMYDSAGIDDRNIAGGRDGNRVVAFWEGYPATTTSYRVSTNGGTSWGGVQRLQRWSDTARVVPYGPMIRLGSYLYQTAYMTVWGYSRIWVYRSTDNGDTWSTHGRIDSTAATVNETAICALPSGRMLAVSRRAEYTADRRMLFYTSTDSGATWSALGVYPKEPSNVDSIAVSPWLYVYSGRVYLAYQWRATVAGHKHTMRLSSASVSSVLDTTAWTAPAIMYTRPWAFVYNPDGGYPSIDYDPYGRPRWFWFSGSYDGAAINSPNLFVSKP